MVAGKFLKKDPGLKNAIKLFVSSTTSQQFKLYIYEERFVHIEAYVLLLHTT